jgi:hypothetical protein
MGWRSAVLVAAISRSQTAAERLRTAAADVGFAAVHALPMRLRTEEIQPARVTTRPRLTADCGGAGQPALRRTQPVVDAPASGLVLPHVREPLPLLGLALPSVCRPPSFRPRSESTLARSSRSATASNRWLWPLTGARAKPMTGAVGLIVFFYLRKRRRASRVVVAERRRNDDSGSHRRDPTRDLRQRCRPNVAGARWMPLRAIGAVA